LLAIMFFWLKLYFWVCRL